MQDVGNTHQKVVYEITANDLLGSIEQAIDRGLNRVLSRNEIRYYDREETAEILHVTVRTLQEWEKDGRLVPRYAGMKALYTKEQIENFLETKEYNM